MQLISEEDMFFVAVEGRYEGRNWKRNNSCTRSGITNNISCDKNV